jgi:tRNA (guanine-N7-)-methyltransferase
VAKRKLQRFSEVDSFSNVVQHLQTGEVLSANPLQGKWRQEFFKNNNPIVVELGCGKGEYTVGMAQANPNKNYIGLDLKGNRIWRGAKTALENKMQNVGFVRTRIENIETVFGAEEVDEIWITFPDPQPQLSREKKRLTSPPFLARYRKILKKGGLMQLKTDNAPFYEYTLQVIKENKLELLDHTSDLYADTSERQPWLKNIQTHYEKIFTAKGFKICYAQFKIH